MQGTMMQFPLTLVSLFERAGKLFPKTEIVSQLPDNSTHRSTYADFHRRARSLAAALQDYGLQPGDRVATLMWNHWMHLEAYFAVPVIGGVLHTLNLRLHPDELAFIVNHAEDRFLIVDDILLPVFEKIRDKVNLDRVFVTRFGGCDLANQYQDYEQLLQQSSGSPHYADLDENDAAGMCYTSGTTGKPKGVVYSHRALVLHAYSISLPDNFSISRHDTVLPAMSMFHANAWGMPHAAVMNGSTLVMPGPNLQPEAILDLLSLHRVTLTGAVPTVWLAVIDTLERQPDRWPLAEGLRIIVAGSACPETLFRRFDRFGVRVIQPWGMTETTPMATVSTLKPHMATWAEDDLYRIRATQGLPSPFVEARAMGDHGEIPWDGETPGELEVRGPFVAAGYYNLPDGKKSLVPGRLAPHRRRGHHRSRGLHQDHRPLQGPDQVGRRMDQLGRSRKCAGCPSRRRRSRGCRGAALQMAGAAVGAGGAQGRSRRGRRRTARISRVHLREMAIARCNPLRRRAAAYVDRKTAEVGVAAQIQGVELAARF